MLGEQVGGGGGERATRTGLELRERIVAHDLGGEHATIRGAIDELARDELGERGLEVQTRRERGERDRRDRDAQHRERLDGRPRGRAERAEIPRGRTEARAGELATQRER